MIFNNAEALLNQLDEEALESIGVSIEPDGTIEGLPDFPFEVPDGKIQPERPWRDAYPVVDKALDTARIHFGDPKMYRF